MKVGEKMMCSSPFRYSGNTYEQYQMLTVTSCDEHEVILVDESNNKLSFSLKIDSIAHLYDFFYTTDEAREQKINVIDGIVKQGDSDVWKPDFKTFDFFEKAQFPHKK